jgi:large repetitive protein
VRFRARPGAVAAASAVALAAWTLIGAGGQAHATVAAATPAATVATSTHIQASGAPATFNGYAAGVTITVDVTSAAGSPPAIWAYTSVTVGRTNCPLEENDACGILFIGAGRFVIKATYWGDGDFQASSATATVTIARAKSSTSLQLSRSTVTYRHEGAEKLTASIRRIGNTTFSGGKITIKAGAITVCTVTIKNDSGSCTLSNTKLKKGSYTLVASFPGNGDLLPSSARKPLKVVG